MPDFASDETTIEVNKDEMDNSSTLAGESNARVVQSLEDACEAWDELLSMWVGDTSIDYQLADITTRDILRDVDSVLKATVQSLDFFSSTAAKINANADANALYSMGDWINNANRPGVTNYTTLLNPFKFE